ncbi:MAG: hypothetical protein Q4C42_03430 [Clostridia bacterium]|nr:hypothetical protein [Clostridia bacterium]
MEKKVLIISCAESNALCIARSFGLNNIHTELLFVSDRAGASGLVEKSEIIKNTVQLKKDESVIIDYLVKLGEKELKEWVLFPTDDYCAFVVDNNKQKLQKYFYFSFIEDGSVVEFMDKSIQAKTAKKCGLATANEWIVHTAGNSTVIPENMEFPCFYKPIMSVKDVKSGIRVFKEKDEFDSWIKARKPGEDILIQEFLDIKFEYDLSGVTNGKEVYIPAVIKKDMVSKVVPGVTLAGHLEPVSVLKDELEKIKKFIIESRYVGMFDFELFVTTKGIYFGDYNMRCGAPSYIYELAGFPLPYIASEMICDEGHNIKIGDVICESGYSFYNGYHSVREVIRGNMTVAELQNLERNCDYDIFSSKDDPRPNDIFNAAFRKNIRMKRLEFRVKKFIKRMIGRA